MLALKLKNLRWRLVSSIDFFYDFTKWAVVIIMRKGACFKFLVPC